MALLDDGKFVAGLMVGYAAGLATPSVARVLPDLVRPLAKAALKAGVGTFERGRESIALLLESVEDLVAEVRAEVESELTRRGAPDAPATGPSSLEQPTQPEAQA